MCSLLNSRRRPGRASIGSMNAFRHKTTVWYRVGDRVNQPAFGDGTVTVVDATHTTVDFDKRGVRTFLSERADLAPVAPAIDPSTAQTPEPRH
jgi:hypothetical protein